MMLQIILVTILRINTVLSPVKLQPLSAEWFFVLSDHKKL